MSKRYLTIWFPHLLTDWFSRRQPALHQVPLVVAAPDHGRLVIVSANALAQSQGIDTGLVVADARAIMPSLIVINNEPGLGNRLLKNMAEWCIRYSPLAGTDPPEGIVLDITGCAHLRGGEEKYLQHLTTRLSGFGYEVRTAIADTIGAAWAVNHFGPACPIIESGTQRAALLKLPPAALRLEAEVLDRLQKLGLNQIQDIIAMPRSALRRRFGQQLLQRFDQALGDQEEVTEPVIPLEAYQERLPCLEPISTAGGIAVALERLLDTLCQRLALEQKGLRTAIFKGYRLDGKIEQVSIGTNRGTHNTKHLFKLFEEKLPTIEPALGIELFTLDAPKVEELSVLQASLWQGVGGLEDNSIAELLDRLQNRVGEGHVHRYLPDQHHWPERSIKTAESLTETPSIAWNIHKPRPMQLLSKPEPIDVAAPVPDYPPMLFRFKGKLHTIKKSDGPERIEAEWWLEGGQHRDYYSVEDEEGNRYWLFRSGHYTADKTHQWFIHGYFS